MAKRLRNLKNVDLKRMCIEIPSVVFDEMDDYCTSPYFPNVKDCSYVTFITQAILFALDNKEMFEKNKYRKDYI